MKKFRVKPQFVSAASKLLSMGIYQTEIVFEENSQVHKKLAHYDVFELFCEEVQDSLVDERFAIKLNIRNFLVFMVGYDGNSKIIHTIYKSFGEDFPEIKEYEKAFKRDNPGIINATITGITEVSKSDFDKFKC